MIKRIISQFEILSYRRAKRKVEELRESIINKWKEGYEVEEGNFHIKKSSKKYVSWKKALKEVLPKYGIESKEVNRIIFDIEESGKESISYSICENKSFKEKRDNEF